MSEINSHIFNKATRSLILFAPEDNVEKGRQWASWLNETIIAKFQSDNESSNQTLDLNNKIKFYDFPSLAKELDTLESMIVICSPRLLKSKSPLVAIDSIKHNYSLEHILLVVIDGMPNASRNLELKQKGYKNIDECLPDTLSNDLKKQDKTNGETPQLTIVDFRVNVIKPVQGWTTKQDYEKELDKHRLSSNTVNRLLREYEAMMAAELNKLYSLFNKEL